MKLLSYKTSCTKTGYKHAEGMGSNEKHSKDRKN